MRVGLLVGLVLWAPLAWAHPGRTDACKGHQVSEEFHYACEDTKGLKVCPPSEAGEYHLHFGQVCMDVAWNTPLGGAFDCEGVHYEIMLETTRDSQSILTCVTPEGERHTGIVRARKE